MLTAFSLLGIGLLTGAFGTLIGVGGGFILVPILLFLYPYESAKTITSISLPVVFFSAFSATVAYARMRRIDYRSGIAFALATIPGAVFGVLATSLLSRALFHLIFGLVLLTIAAYIFFRPGARPKALSWGGRIHRVITERDGTAYTYSFSLRLGILISFMVGSIATMLGLGGGIIHVPALVALLSFPPHVAIATSLFVLTITALTGTATHLATGGLTAIWGRVLLLSAGVIIGAQIGARLSSRVRGRHIVRLLALALAAVGLRLILGSLLLRF